MSKTLVVLFAAFSMASTFAAPFSSGVKGTLRAVALFGPQATRELKADVQKDGSITAFSIKETSEGKVTALSFDDRFASLKGEEVLPSHFNSHFEGGWGYDGEANFGGTGILYDFGMQSETRGAFKSLVVEKGFNTGNRDGLKCTFVDSGDDAPTSFIPAICAFTQN